MFGETKGRPKTVPVSTDSGTIENQNIGLISKRQLITRSRKTSTSIRPERDLQGKGGEGRILGLEHFEFEEEQLNGTDDRPAAHC